MLLKCPGARNRLQRSLVDDFYPEQKAELFRGKRQKNAFYVREKEVKEAENLALWTPN